MFAGPGARRGPFRDEMGHSSGTKVKTVQNNPAIRCLAQVASSTGAAVALCPGSSEPSSQRWPGSFFQGWHRLIIKSRPLPGALEMPEPQDQMLKHIELVFLQDSALLQAQGRQSEGLCADQTAC